MAYLASLKAGERSDERQAGSHVLSARMVTVVGTEHGLDTDTQGLAYPQQLTEDLG